MPAPSINPSLEDLWHGNSVVGGVARRHDTGVVSAPFSIKAVAGGEAWWRVDGRDMRVTPDSFLIVNEGQSYELRIDSITEVQTRCLFFSPELIRVVAGTLDPRRTDAPEFSSSLRPRTALLDRVLRPGREITEDDFVAVAEEMVEARVGEVRAAQSLGHAQASVREEVYRRLDTARELMIAEFDGKLTLARVAQEASLSPYHFHRLFRSAFGLTPHAFLTSQRLRAARRLLETTDLDLQTICLSVGAESVSSFSRGFRQQLGVSPGRYRDSQDRTCASRSD